MTLKNTLIGIGAAAGIGAFLIAVRKTHGLTRYAVGLAGVGALRRLLRDANESYNRNNQRDVVDFNSEQSFPASDPPSWTAG